MTPASPPDPVRRDALRALLAAALAGAVPAGALAAAAPCPGPWSEWQRFVARHVEDNGRVVDFVNADLRSTSESQSYGLFFALVDNDPFLFERILAWTRRNLSKGRADLNLPAWLWGRSPDGQWGVLDPNSASDGELWIAYALLEAGRLWNRPGFVQAGRQILALIRKAEVAELPGFGPMLLPGNQGYVHGNGWLLNPCYLPLFVFRCFAAHDPKGPWNRLAERSVELVRRAAPNGFVPDWIRWNGRDFVVDPDKGPMGSYDAIRTYLWAGMTDPADPLRKPLLAALSGPLRMLRAQGGFAEKVDVRNGVGVGTPPPGFAAALLPYLSALGQPALVRSQAALVPSSGAAADALTYYDRCLLLFGKGWLDRRYRISADGRLQPAWSTACSTRR